MATYPLRTPRTKLSIKNEPITIRGTKYIQLNCEPKASLVWKRCMTDLLVFSVLVIKNRKKNKVKVLLFIRLSLSYNKSYF